MRIGVQIYSLRDDIKDIPSLIKTFEYLQSIGAETVELAGMPKVAPKELAELSARTGVQIISSHNSIKDIKNNLTELTSEHLLYGAKFIGISSIPIKYCRSMKSVQKFARIMNEAATFAGESGLSMIYHNHAFEFQKKYGKNKETLFDILLNTFSENVKICLDCYWAYSAGVNVANLIARIGSRLAILHCKDLPEGGSVNGFKMCAPGRGVLNYNEYITAASLVGCEHALVELDESFNPTEELAYGVKELKKILNSSIV